MNGWSARIVTNASNLIRLVGGFLIAALCAPQAHAQEAAAQALYGVKEIIVRPVRFDDPATAKACRLTAEDVDAAILQALKDNNLPATPEAQARPTTVETPRIMLVPQIVPYNGGGLDCATWVALSAETRNHLRVLPIEIPRIVNVVYWHEGEIVASAVSVHGDHVTASLNDMIHRFGQKYILAQPPTVGRPTAPAPR